MVMLRYVSFNMLEGPGLLGAAALGQGSDAWIASPLSGPGQSLGSAGTEIAVQLQGL